MQPIKNETMIKFTKPFCEIWEQEPGIKGMFKQIERCGRISYKSEDKITDDSYKEFVARMKRLGHNTVLEHGTVYLKEFVGSDKSKSKLAKYARNKYSWIHCDESIYMDNPCYTYYVVSNYRVLVENGWEDDLVFWCEPDFHFTERICFHFITDRGVSAEANRHRVNSVVERSTRYVDYSGVKTGGNVRIQFPQEFNDGINANELDEEDFRDMCKRFSQFNDNKWTPLDYWVFANLASVFSYKNLRRLGWSAQQARRVLPLDVETELVHTAFIADWMRFFELRCSEKAHPDMQVIANEMKKQFFDIKK